MDPLTYDVAVVGGGMAGISIAAELAGEQSVALFEAEDQLGCHATGRSAAVYLPSYGGPLARVLTVASRPLFDELSEEGEVVLLKPRPLLVVAIDDSSEGLIRAWVEAAVGMDRVDPVDALGLCPVLRPEVVRGGGLDAAGMDVDVSGLQEVYRRRLRRRGGTLHVSAPVSAITPVSGGWKLEARGQHFTVGALVDAAGAWADRVAAMAGLTPLGLLPRRRTAFVSPPHDGLCRADRAGWPLVADGRDRWYFKPDAGGVLVSPADEAPSEPCDARPDELEIARAIDGVNEATQLALKSVSHSWAGLRSFVPDGEPVVGAYASNPSFVFAAGQGGYGIQLAPALAEVAASLLRTGAVPTWLSAAGVSEADVGPERLLL